MKPYRKFLTPLFASVLALGATSVSTVQAQTDFPNKPVTVIVPYSAGGPTDQIARHLAQSLSSLWEQPVVVENRTGASGIIALTALSRAEADGYTLGVMATPVTAIAPLTQKNFELDVTEDFTAVSSLMDYTLILLAGPQAKAESIQDLVKRAKADPKAISYGSSGVGGTNHLAGEIFSRAAQAPMLHVPYKGDAPAISDTMAGQISFVFAQTDAAIGFVDSGKLTPLAITSAKRNPSVPDVPTFAEQGLPDVLVEGWIGVLAPHGLPAETIKALEESIAQVKESPEFAERWKSLGYVVTPTSSEEFSQRVKGERDFWKNKIEEEKIQLQ